MSLRSIGKKYSKEELDLAAQNLLLASSNPTVSVFKTHSSEKIKKREKEKDNGTLTEHQTDNN